MPSIIHLFKTFTYLNEFFKARGQGGSDKRGSTVIKLKLIQQKS